MPVVRDGLLQVPWPDRAPRDCAEASAPPWSDSRPRVQGLLIGFVRRGRAHLRRAMIGQFDEFVGSHDAFLGVACVQDFRFCVGHLLLLVLQISGPRTLKVNVPRPDLFDTLLSAPDIVHGWI